MRLLVVGIIMGCLDDYMALKPEAIMPWTAVSITNQIDCSRNEK